MNPETTTCVFAHSDLNGIYYCAEADTGMTQSLQEATKFMGAASRERGLKTLKERYPNVNEKQLIMYYLS